MTTQTTTPTQAATGRPVREHAPHGRGIRIRGASEVLGILEPRPVNPMAAVPAGFWKTGWLPKPQGATS